MSFLANLFNTKQDTLNAGFKRYLDITLDGKEKIKTEFQKSNPDISVETINSYFDKYKDAYNYSEKRLADLLNQSDDTNYIKVTFFESASNKFNWIDKSNLKKLYSTCSFYLK